MMLNNEKYYFRFGLRRFNMLTNPRTFTWTTFNFPKDANYHYCSYDSNSLGPDPEDKFFQAIPKKIPFIDFTELKNISQGGIKKTVVYSNLTKKYKINGRKKFIYYSKDKKFENQPMVPVIYNYDLMQYGVEYNNLPLTNYNKWKDIFISFWDHFSEVCKNSSRMNFIVVELPDNIPSIQLLRKYSNAISPQIVQDLPDYKSLFILELWKFFNNDQAKEKSIIKEKIRIKDYEKINLILKYNNKWALVNLAYLYKWVIKDKGEEDIELAGVKAAANRDRMQRLLLTLYMKIIESDANDAVYEDLMEDTNTSIHLDDDLKPAQYDKDSNIEDAEFRDNSNTDTQEITQDIDKDKLEGDHDNEIYDEEIDKNTITPNQPVILSGQNVYRNNLVVSRKRKGKVGEITSEELRDYVYTDDTPTNVLNDIADSYLDENIISNIDYRKLKKDINKTTELISPLDNKKTLVDYIKIKPEELQLDTKKTVLPDNINVDDPSMKNSTLSSFDDSYISNVLNKDIASMIYSIQKSGVLIQDYKIDKVVSVLGNYDIHTIKIKPIDGAASVIKFRIPKVDPKTASFRVNGIDYYMRKQRADLPIRKIRPNRVCLSSYYCKTFVYRSEHRVNDGMEWIANNIIEEGLSGKSENVLSIEPSNVFDNTAKTPRIYSGMATRFKSIKFKNVTLDFKYSQRETIFGKANILKYEKNGNVLCGHDNTGNPITVNDNDVFILHKGNNEIPLGNICDLAKLEERNMPVEYSTISVLGKKNIPVGIVLGYFLGIDNLLKLIKVKYKEIDKRAHYELAKDEWALQFKDKKLIFSRKDKYTSLIMGGFREYKGSIKRYSYDEFNGPNVYLNILDSKGLTSRYIREIESMNSLFIDPITKSILEQMKEPTTFLGLLLRATEMIVKDDHPDEIDARGFRVRGYERFAGFVYNELAKSVRTFKVKNIRGNSKVDMSPFAVWTHIAEDPSKMPIANINPIEQLKQAENITLVGDGGRSKLSMKPKYTREYHVTDIGMIAENNPQTVDTGINMTMPANPSITNLRGMTKLFDLRQGGTANFLTSVGNCAVAIEHEAPVRAGFTFTQHGHTVACVDYHQPLLRTGYEAMIAHRLNEPFALTAKKPAKVISVSDDGIVIEDEDGQRGYPLGTQYGTSEGSIYCHDLVTMFKKGDKINVGEPIFYNKSFFEPDYLNPRQIIWKTATMVKTVLCECPQTLEDGCSISKRLGDRFTTSKISLRSFTLEFTQGVKSIVKPGTKVEPDDILFIIEDSTTEELNIFDEKTLKSLQKLSNKSPKAKHKGTIDRIEVFYNGDLKDMSSSLRSLATYSNSEFAKKCKARGAEVFNGKVDSEYRVQGEPLIEGTANIKVYIRESHDAGVGDKLIFSSQLKSVIGEVMDYELKSETGETIDAIFGHKSVANRVVLSPYIIGTTNTLLNIITDKAIKMYFGEK